MKKSPWADPEIPQEEEKAFDFKEYSDKARLVRGALLGAAVKLGPAAVIAGAGPAIAQVWLVSLREQYEPTKEMFLEHMGLAFEAGKQILDTQLKEAVAEQLEQSFDKVGA